MKFKFFNFRLFFVFFLMFFSFSNLIYGDEQDNIEKIKTLLENIKVERGEDQSLVEANEKNIEEYREILKKEDENDVSELINRLGEENDVVNDLKIAAILENKGDYDISNVNLDNFETSTVVKLANTGDEGASINELIRRVNRDGELDDDELILVASIDNNELKERIYISRQDNADTLKSLCENSPQDCLTDIEPQNLEELIGQTNSINQGDLVSCLETPDCRNNLESDEDFINNYNEENCEGVFNSLTACYFADQIDNREIFADSLRQRVEEDDFDLGLPVDIEGELSNEERINCEGISAQSCIEEAENLCGDDEDCSNQARDAILRKATVESAADMTEYNNNLGLNFVDEYCGSDDQCQFDRDECSEGDCIEHIREVCGDDDYKCATGLDFLDSQKMVETNEFYAVAYWVTNQDENTQRVMDRIFGGPVGFDSPAFITKPFASQICYAKYKGYLDKENVAGGGVTVYGGNETNREVRADVRAQHTAVTPDNETSIVFSYYLKSLNEPLNYRVSFSYKDTRDNTINITNLISTEKLPRDSSTSDYNPDVQEKVIPQQYLSNFTIHLVAVDDEGNKEYSISHPIILITSSDRDIGEIQANRDDSESENSGENQEEIDIDQVITDSILGDIN